MESISLINAPRRDNFVNELFGKVIPELLAKDDKLCHIHDILLTALTKLKQIKNDPLCEAQSLCEMKLLEGVEKIKESRMGELMKGMSWPRDICELVGKLGNSKAQFLFGPEMAEEYLIHRVKQSRS